MDELKHILVQCLTSLGDAPQLFDSCIPLISSLIFNAIKLHQSDNTLKLLTTNEANPEIKWIFFPYLQTLSTVQTTDNILYHPHFKLSNHESYTLQKQMLSLIFYSTQFVHTKLIKHNKNIFHQTNGAHKYDNLFFIPSLYCCPNNFYFTTTQFIQLLYKLNMKSLFIQCIINYNDFHIFEWLHHQYCNAQNIKYAKDALNYKLHCIETVLDEFMLCDNESIPLMYEFIIIIISDLNKQLLSKQKHVKTDKYLMKLLKYALRCVDGKEICNELTKKQAETLYYNASIWLFIVFDLVNRRKDKIDGNLVKYVLNLFKTLNTNYEYFKNDADDLQCIIYDLSQSISKILVNVNDDTNLQSYFGQFFSFETEINDNFFYCQVLLSLKIICFQVNKQKKNKSEIDIDCWNKLHKIYLNESNLKLQLMNEWNKLIQSLSMQQILNILHDSNSNSIENALNQLINSGYTQTMQIFLQNELCKSLQIFVSDIRNNLKLCKMIFYVYKYGVNLVIDNKNEQNALNKCQEWKDLFLISYSMLHSDEQYFITKEIYKNENNMIAFDDNDMNERILLFFNCLLNDSNFDVLTLREFSIISLLSPSKTITALISNIVLHHKSATLIANILTKYPLLLYYKHLLWQKISDFVTEKLKIGLIQNNAAKCIAVFVNTLINNKILDVIVPFKIFIIPLFKLCFKYGNKNVFPFINDLIVPILTNIFEKKDIDEMINLYCTLSQKYDDSQRDSSELMSLSMQCLEILISLNNRKKLKQSSEDIIDCVQICMSLNITFIYKLYEILQWKDNSLIPIINNNKWINIFLLRSLFECKCLNINDILTDIKEKMFWKNIIISFEILNINSNIKQIDFEDQTICSVFDKLYAHCTEYNINFLDIAVIDDGCCELIICLIINYYKMKPSETIKMYELFNKDLVFKLCKILPLLCENEVFRLINHLILSLCDYCENRRDIIGIFGTLPFDKTMSIYFEHKLSCIMIVFRCLKLLIYETDCFRYRKCLNYCLKIMNVICNNYEMQRTQIYEVIALKYCIYRNCAQLLFKMNAFKFNTNYIFIFLCENLKNILDEMDKKLKNILEIKKKNKETKQQFYNIEQIIKDICILINLELNQLPVQFKNLLTKIVDDYTKANLVSSRNI